MWTVEGDTGRISIDDGLESVVMADTNERPRSGWYSRRGGTSAGSPTGAGGTSNSCVFSGATVTVAVVGL